MSFESLEDFAAQANRTIGDFRREFILSPDQLTAQRFSVCQLHWNSIPYGNEHANKVPNDKRGVYAFVVSYPTNILPHHGYVMYIGMAGRDSRHTLRERYRDCLNTRNLAKTRPTIAFMIGNWQRVLRFFYAPVEDELPPEELKQLELDLNSAFMPPFSKNDLHAEAKLPRRASL